MKYTLIIDNDEMLCTVLSDQLKRAGIEVQEAVDGLEGLDKAIAQHPAVIILDEHMPHMNGQQFIEALQKQPWYKEVHIIVFTTLHDVDLMNHKILAGVSDYLDKSKASPEQIVELVKKYMPPQEAAANAEVPPQSPAV
jgi:two-component system chemotaxis response regulator CheY